MAKRWSFEEDYVVGKFCLKYKGLEICGLLLDELMEELHQNGFASRTEVAVSRRARDFTYLFRGWDSPYAVKQVRNIYKIFNYEGYENHLKNLQIFINQRQLKAGDIYISEFSINTLNDLTHMVHKPKGRKFIDVLEDYIQNSGINPKSRIYRDVGMKQETYSAIRRGKYNSISRENLYRLCFGLRLSYDQAINLMGSCGCILRGDSVLDAVVEYYLRQGPTVDSVNRVKQENGGNKTKEVICYIYDTDQIDADLIESKAPILFWTKSEDDEE